LTALAESAWRAVIAPVTAHSRPRWSVMIPSFNRASYVGATIESVLAQDPGPELMQIEVVDDCSGDDVEQVVAEVGRGRVDFFRQPENVGSARNFATCLRRARGELVHLLHSDDAVLPDFYETLQRPFDALPELGAAFCRYRVIDAQGNRLQLGDQEQQQPGVLEGWLTKIALGQRLQTPCMVVRRSVYEDLGGFDERLSYCEDWEMWVRIAAHYPVWYEPEPLALYRIHSTSISGASLRTGANVADLRIAIRLHRPLLPPAREREITAAALEETATTALRRGGRALGTGDARAFWAQAREAFKTSRSPVVFRAALRHALSGAGYWTWRTIKGLRPAIGGRRKG
jgi:GT2 family glycosyltransferase